MMFLGQMGLGMLANLVGASNLNGGNNAARNQEAMDDLRAEMNEAVESPYDPTHSTSTKGMLSQLGLNAPPFPDKAAQGLAQMQQNNYQARQEFMGNADKEMQEMKDNFFSFNHLETEENPETGEHQVALSDDGKPQVADGGETPDQKTARTTYEDSKNDQLADSHQQQQDQFNQQERDNIQQFLQNNKPDLGNPAVQAELQRTLLQSQKKALNLSRDQQGELIKANLYTPEQNELADAQLGQLRQMEDEHAQMEDNSPEAGELYQHQQDLADLLRQKRDEAQQASLEEAFLKGPPRFSASSDKEIDVAEVLPPYLSHALYNMGIYSV